MTIVSRLRSSSRRCGATANLALSGPAQSRTYLVGSELLDPQYHKYPADISREDFRHYFEPIALTDAAGGPADWLKPYVPQTHKKQRPALSDAREAVSAHTLADNAQTAAAFPSNTGVMLTSSFLDRFEE